MKQSQDQKPERIRLQMFCSTCGQNLDYNPQTYFEPIRALSAPEEIADQMSGPYEQGYDSNYLVFALDLSSHECGCAPEAHRDWHVRLV